MNLRKASYIAASMLMLLVFVKMNSDIGAFIDSVKKGEAVYAMGAPSLTEAEKRELYNAIVAEAETRYVAPVDARIDRVWHAIPGYNGLAVDIEATYAAALRQPRAGSIPYRYKEIEPKIGLDQLGPQPIYRANPDKPIVSFMVNVAWGNEHIAPILETMRKEGVKATFFLDGSWLKNNVELARTIGAEGHELANHAYSHPQMSALGRSAQYEQIAKTERLLKEQLGVSNKWFSPPSGDYNAATVQVAREQGLHTILWTIDTVDWKKPSPETIVRRVSRKLEPGALILMHPTESSRDALQGMIEAARAKGLSIGTVSEALSSSRQQAMVERPDIF